MSQPIECVGRRRLIVGRDGDQVTLGIWLATVVGSTPATDLHPASAGWKPLAQLRLEPSQAAELRSALATALAVQNP